MNKTDIIKNAIEESSVIFMRLGQEQLLTPLIGIFNTRLFNAPLINFNNAFESMMDEIASDPNLYDIFLTLTLRMGLVIDLEELKSALIQEIQSIKENDYFKSSTIELHDNVEVVGLFIRIFTNELISTGVEVANGGKGKV